tara:strand:+ start:228 stop:662 length:435 start_codon:yes stop_codon:yes gene_type:complete
MTAFDTAWEVVKMPFHGTSSKRWKEIQEAGSLKPNLDSMGNHLAWFAGSPIEALTHATKAADRDRERWPESHPDTYPVIIHSEPTQEMEAGNDNPRFWTSETDVPSDTFSEVWSDEDYRTAESAQERINRVMRHHKELEGLKRE